MGFSIELSGKEKVTTVQNSTLKLISKSYENAA